jgi:hypothetical protein
MVETLAQTARKPPARMILPRPKDFQRKASRRRTTKASRR